jgi:glycosyltransferase involved in cell wall biosynthesis
VIAAVLHAEHRFDVVHQLGPCGFKNPGRLYELNVPSVWGPIIGWHYYNLRLAYTQGFRLLIYAIGWNLANYVYSHDLNIKRAANGYDRFIFGTPETRDRFARRFGVSGVLLPEQGIVSDVTSNAISNERLNGSQSYINRSEDASLHVIWVGTIEFRKNLKLLLEVIRNLQSERFIFHIVGDGPQSFDLFKEYKDVFEMPTVFQYKRLPRADLLSLMRRTDVIVFTTLAEGNTSVLFEALEGSIVPIGPNINGFSNTLGEGGGILIDYNQSYRDIVEAYSIALKSLLKPEKYIDQLCRTSLKKKRFLFDEITSTYYEIYQSAVRKHRD